MRFSTSGSLRRIDISLLAEALAALRKEWSALRFDATGHVVNPLTGASLDTLRLLEGRHRAVGARYEIVTRTPETTWDATAQDFVPTGTINETSTFLVIRGDDARTLSVSVHDLEAQWSVDVDVVHDRLPRIELSGAADVTEMMKGEVGAGCLSWLVGGTASGRATIDLGVVERRSGTLADGSGRYNRFRANGAVTISTSAREWDVDAKARVKTKGLARLAALIFRGRITTAADEAIARFWRDAPAAVDEADRELHQARQLVADEGGVDQVVHRMLWEEGYADRLDAAHPSA